MKKNEPVRSGGIGRKQIAWQTGKALSQGSTIQDLLQEQSDEFSTQANQAQHMATLSNATAISRAIAYSAASSAMSNNQNEIWGVRGVADFTTDANGAGFVKWDNKGTLYQYNWQQINNPYMYIDSDDNAKIRVNRPGWYLVDALVVVENYKNSQDYTMDIVLDDTEIIVVGFDKVHTNQYPTLRVNAIVPIPAVVTDITPATTHYFRVRWSASGLSTATTLQGDGFIHAIWLKPWEADESHASN